MNTALWTTVTVVLVYATVIAHEAGHAVAFRRAGVRVAEIGFGAQLPPRITLAPTPRRPFALVLSPWLVGAHVRPHGDDHGRMHELPYRDRAWISGSGITVNLVLGLLALLPVTLLHGRWPIASAITGLAVLLWAARKVFVAYVVPLLVLPIAAVTVWLTVSTYSRPKSQFVGELADLLPTSPIQALTLAGIVSLMLGMVNTLPFAPLDGHRIAVDAVDALLGERVGTIVWKFAKAGGWMLLASEAVFAGWLFLT